jgi:hypothetical protein
LDVAQLLVQSGANIEAQDRVSDIWIEFNWWFSVHFIFMFSSFISTWIRTYTLLRINVHLLLLFSQESNDSYHYRKRRAHWEFGEPNEGKLFQLQILIVK